LNFAAATMPGRPETRISTIQTVAALLARNEPVQLPITRGRRAIQSIRIGAMGRMKRGPRKLTEVPQ
jgi:hypothetical protein